MLRLTSEMINNKYGFLDKKSTQESELVILSSVTLLLGNMKIINVSLQEVTTRTLDR